MRDLEIELVGEMLNTALNTNVEREIEKRMKVARDAVKSPVSQSADFEESKPKKRVNFAESPHRFSSMHSVE